MSTQPAWIGEVSAAIDNLDAAVSELELGRGNIESAISEIRRANMRLLHALATAPKPDDAEAESTRRARAFVGMLAERSQDDGHGSYRQ